MDGFLEVNNLPQPCRHLLDCECVETQSLTGEPCLIIIEVTIGILLFAFIVTTFMLRTCYITLSPVLKQLNIVWGQNSRDT